MILSSSEIKLERSLSIGLHLRRISLHRTMEISLHRTDLSKMVSSVSNAFSGIGLLLNQEKCEFSSFVSTFSSLFNCDTFSIPSLDSLRGLGISLYFPVFVSTLFTTFLKEYNLDMGKLFPIEGNIIDEHWQNSTLHTAINPSFIRHEFTPS